MPPSQVSNLFRCFYNALDAVSPKIVSILTH